MAKLHAYLTKAGVYAGEIIETGPNVSLAALAARCPDFAVIDASLNARPPNAPASAQQIATDTKRARLAVLRAKGWALLTLGEKNEARVLSFDLGEPSPPSV